MATILAIDQGTTETKALVVGESGRILATASAPVRPWYLDGGGVQLEPEAVWQSVLATGRQALAQAGRSVDAVALANQGESVLAFDPLTGQALSPVLVWQDRRAAGICQDAVEHAPLVSARTGLRLDPYFSAPKMSWIRRHETREGMVATLDTWLLFRLTGQLVTDASTASRSLLTGLGSHGWDPRLLEVFGLENEQLPKIVACDEVVGTTDAFGNRPLPVAGVILDQPAALFAQRCLTAGEATCTYGTGGFLLANVGARVPAAGSLTCSVAWRARGRDTYCRDGQVYTAGSAITWLVKLGVLDSPGNLDHAVAPGGPGQVVCVPALAGHAAPWWQPGATGSLHGLTLSTKPGHIVSALIYGLAAMVTELAEAAGADTGNAITVLRAGGGLTRSRALVQAQADLLQTPVHVHPGTHATALGAAGFARLALDRQLEMQDAVMEPAQLPTVIEPLWSADRATAYRALWREAREAADPSADHMMAPA
jgi:glycerol kinase